MKAVLRLGCFTFAILIMVVPNASADQVTYSFNEEGGSGVITGGAPTFLNETVYADLGTYQFTGSVNPSRTGLIGVRSGFRAAVSRSVDGFTPEPSGGGPIGGGQEPDSNTGVGDGPGDFPSTQWKRITIETSAVGSFRTRVNINGLSEFNNIGFVRFDWFLTGTSGLALNSEGSGEISVHDAVSIATLNDNQNLAVPDTFAHSAPTGSSFDVFESASLDAMDTYLLPYDTNQLSEGEIPQIDVDFELLVATRLDVTNVDDLGNFEALFDADFSNTATLLNVSVLDSTGALIPDAYVTDSVTGQSIVASSVPEPSTTLALVLSCCAGAIRRRRCEI